MSIPGLGQIPAQAPESATRTFQLAPLSEWRFAVSQPPITVRLLAGTAERDGTELAANQPYRFAGTLSKILTWHGCELEVDGACDREEVCPGGTKPAWSGEAAAALSPMVSYLNLHLLLASQRAAAAATALPAAATAGSTAAAANSRGAPGSTGPRLLVCGPPHAGRTSLVRMLAAWATKAGGGGADAGGNPPYQPCVVNVDPAEGMLSLPGTLSAAVFATLMDLETEGGAGWGGAPSSGPSAVPVKLPLVYHFGYARPTDAPALYRTLVTRLAGAVAARVSEDAAVRASGLLVDTPAIGPGDSDGSDVDENQYETSVDLLAHVVEEFSINLVVVLGSDGGPAGSSRLYQALVRRLAGETTTLGEPVQVVPLAASDGVVARSDSVLQQQREACIKEYFFGDAKRTLSPYTQQVDCDSLTVYRLPEAGAPNHDLVKIDAGPALAHWTLAVMNASVHDPPDVIQNTTALGFVYVAEVDGERKKIRILAPVSGRLGDRPLVFGRWPEPYINLVG
ncbi:mRNA cleavage factor complex 2 protein [Niveomyces insectorum RCEF 264]|uniref:Polynucleotide 5'-hydroxyl-kinase GRC3 n=1 Tax=Niveomyces insectorum RCEF 264 TaxID=1081102 RepID=A0A162MTM0_9HYPO|nr:mRNA cleavage factor complex 2 protein [Niveomyces insectorum RCEF 264]